MEGVNISPFWILATLFGTTWIVGTYLIVRGLSRSTRIQTFETKTKPEPEKQLFQEETIPQFPKKDIILEELEVPIKEVIKDQEPHEPPQKEFYEELGKSNIIEFPAEYINEISVKGLDGNETGFVEFAKSCYLQIGFRCLDTVLTEKKAGLLYKISIFDLVCDHYSSDEERFINFFAELKKNLSDRVLSIRSNPDFIYKNMKELVGSYEDLPQLMVWDDKELFLVFVKSRYEELAQKEILWLREFIIQKKLFKTKIFRVVEKKSEALPPVSKPLTPPSPTFAKTYVETKKISRKPFTREETEFLKENRDSLTNEEMAQRLGRSVDSITHKLSRLGLSRETFEWTGAKEDFLKNNFGRLSYKILSERLGTTVPSIRARCKKLGLKK